MIRVLGFCASPRSGNSEFLLSEAVGAVKRRAGETGEEAIIKTCGVRGKKIAGCVMCQGCMEDGICRVRDDFEELQELWIEADAVIYSIPVYHMGIPAQMKAFIDRLGNSMFGRYKTMYGQSLTVFPKSLKTIGCITQGIHLFSGQEHTVTQVVNHALICGCVPVAGDMWESYIGASGWTRNDERKNALKEQFESGGEEARAAVYASRSVAVRTFDMAVLLKRGGSASPEIIRDPAYTAFADRLR